MDPLLKENAMADLAQRILCGDGIALARTATLIQKRSEQATALLRELFPHTGKALIASFIGPPGVGKSTLVDQTSRLLREKNNSVGIIILDFEAASSGELLGDRIRMIDDHLDLKVFVRSVSCRGCLETAVAADMAILLDAAGTDAVFIDAVGIQQSEVGIARQSDIVVRVLAPGSGACDQASADAIPELANVFVVNKADQAGATELESKVKLHVSSIPRKDSPLPPVISTVATESRGIEELVSNIQAVYAMGRSTRQVDTWEQRLGEMLSERLCRSVPRSEIYRGTRDIVEHRRDPLPSSRTALGACTAFIDPDTTIPISCDAT